MKDEMDFARLIRRAVRRNPYRPSVRYIRGQLASCAAAHIESQFFVHTFSIFICGQSTRFVR
jgi:hypothetical protein